MAEQQLKYPHVFIFLAEKPDDLRAAVLMDFENHQLPAILDGVYKAAFKEKNHENADLLVNFWSLAEEKDESRFTEKEMDSMIKTFGDKFWEKEWKFYHLNDPSSEQFPPIHFSISSY